MKKETRQFILDLLVRELEAEYLQDSPEPESIDYVIELIEASKDFAMTCRDWAMTYIINDAIKKLKEVSNKNDK